MQDKLLWNYLDNLPGLQASFCEWQDKLVSWSGWLLFQKRHLQLTQTEALAINCKTECSFGCPRKIVKYSTDDIIAVCQEQEATPYGLSYKDLLVYTLNRASLFKNIASALEFDLQPVKIDNSPLTWQLGEYRPTAGFSYPIYMTFPADSDMLLESVKTICLNQSSKFVLILPTRKKLTKPVADLLIKKETSLFILAEEFSFSEKSDFVLKRTPQQIFAPFLKELPQPKSNLVAHFNTPVGITWEDIKIVFIDGHTVSIKTSTNEVSGRYNYTQMGMVNTKNSDRNLQWILLQKFSESGGEISWKSRHASDTLKKQKQELSLRLISFFRLEGDPIIWDKKEKCYRCIFTISPESAEY